MSIDAFEKREQVLELQSRVLQAEQERLSGAKTMSVSEARKALSDPVLDAIERLEDFPDSGRGSGFTSAEHLSIYGQGKGADG